MRKIAKLSLTLAILAASLGFAPTPSGAASSILVCRACCSRDASGTCVTYVNCTMVNGHCFCPPCPV